MKFTSVLILAIFAAALYCSDAYPQGTVKGLSGSGNMNGKVLLHTTGIEEGHQHTAACFGFGQPPAQPTSAPATTAAASR